MKPGSDDGSRSAELLSWRIGDVKVTRVIEEETTSEYSEQYPFIREADPAALLDISWLQPHFVTPEGAVKWSTHALLVEAPGGVKLVVDTCVGNDKVRRYLGDKALSTEFLKRFAETGCRREEVAAVVCTHLHVDHVGWNTMLGPNGRWLPTFPNARYLIGATEYEHWRGDPGEEEQKILADSVQPLFDLGIVDLVESDHRISPEIRLLPTPGHTPGHVGVEIASQGERALITGDLIHHPCQLAHLDWATDYDVDRAAATATRRAFVCEATDQPVLIIGTHFATPTAGRIVRDGEVFRLAV